MSTSKSKQHRQHGSSNNIQGKVEMTPQEEFYQLVDSGKLQELRKLLSTKGHEITVDGPDSLGKTALRMAVENDSMEIAELLLESSNPQNVYESLCLAITLDRENISEKIIRHQKYAEYKQMLAECDGGQGLISESSSEATPLMLAAEKNQYEIVQLLLMQGERIDEPHESTCKCENCRELAYKDGLQVAKARLYAYKGLCSDAYITLATDGDPFTKAFMLSRKTQKLAIKEKHFKKEYKKFSDQLNDYTYKLLDRVQTEEELELIINKPSKGVMLGKSSSLGLLKMAILYDFKTFVAHAYIQRLLTTMWYGHLYRKLYGMKFYQSLILGVIFIPIFPIAALLKVIFPFSEVTRFMQVPFIKFVSFCITQIFFILVIVGYSTAESTSIGYTLANHPEIGPHYEVYVQASRQQGRIYAPPFLIRAPSIGMLTVFLFIWILGLIFKSCSEIYAVGARYHAKNTMNIMDFLAQMMYLMVIAIKITVALQVKSATDYFSESPENWLGLHTLDRKSLLSLYWINADRYYWDTYDPLIISECLFAVANILSVCRLVGLFVVNEKLGPMVISLGNMVDDISKFMVLFFMIIVAFIIGFLNLYWYYNPQVRVTAEIEEHEELLENTVFENPQLIGRSVFWSVFGMTDLEVVEISGYRFDNVTTTVGSIIFGVYNWLMIIILINMLIGMMARSYETVAEAEDDEWKFARTKLYLDYFDLEDLPVPFNLVPSWYNICKRFNCFGCNQDCIASCKSKDKDNADEDSSSNHSNRRTATEADNEVFEMETREETQTDAEINNPRKRSRKKGKSGLTYELVIARLIRRHMIYGSNDAADDDDDDDRGGGIDEETRRAISNIRSDVAKHIKTTDDNKDEIDGCLQAIQKNIHYQQDTLSEILEFLPCTRTKVLETVNDKCDSILDSLEGMASQYQTLSVAYERQRTKVQALEEENQQLKAMIDQQAMNSNVENKVEQMFLELQKSNLAMQEKLLQIATSTDKQHQANSEPSSPMFSDNVYFKLMPPPAASKAPPSNETDYEVPSHDDIVDDNMEGHRRIKVLKIDDVNQLRTKLPNKDDTQSLNDDDMPDVPHQDVPHQDVPHQDVPHQDEMNEGYSQHTLAGDKGVMTVTIT